MYYVVFTVLRLIVLFVKGIIAKAIDTMNRLPVFALTIACVRPDLIPGMCGIKCRLFYKRNHPSLCSGQFFGVFLICGWQSKRQSYGKAIQRLNEKMMRKGSGEKGRENVVSLTCHSLSPLFSHLNEKHTKKNCMPCRLRLPKTSSRNTSFYLFIFIFICLLLCKWPLCMITSDGQISLPSSSFVSKILCICSLCAWVFFSNVLPWKFIYI